MTHAVTIILLTPSEAFSAVVHVDHVGEWLSIHLHIVDGRNPASPWMVETI